MVSSSARTRCYHKQRQRSNMKTTKMTCFALLLATAAASAGTCAKCTWGSGPCIDANGACSPYTCAVALDPDGSCPRGSATNVCSCKTTYCDQSSDDGKDACCGNGCPTHRGVATKESPKDCMTLGSLTNCTKLHVHSFCGTSPDPAARFTDGTGWSRPFTSWTRAGSFSEGLHQGRELDKMRFDPP